MPVQIERKRNPQYEAIRTGIKALEKLQTKVGWFETNKYPAVGKGKSPLPVAYVATIQEFGYAAGNIPPRPFFRPTIDAQKEAWKTLLQKAAARVVNGKMTAYQAMEVLGLQAAGDVRLTIANLQTPALSDRTKEARKKRGNASEKPLVDTRILLPTLTHVTEEGK